MKILSLNTGVPDGNAKWWNILLRVEYFRSRGHTVDVITYYDPNNHSPGKIDRIHKNYDIEMITSHLYSTPIIHIKNIVNRSKTYDVVYAENYLATFSGIAEKLQNTPLIFSLHGDVYQESLLKKYLGEGNNKNHLKILLEKYMGRINYRMSDHICCVSRTMVDYVSEKWRVPKNKLTYIPNMVDLEYFNSEKVDEIELDYSFPNEGGLTFGYIGGFQAWQGVDNLIEAADVVKTSIANFVIVGEKAGSSENVYREGRVTRDTVRRYYNLCDVLVLPRPSHPATEIAAPTKFAEYTAMGKPILATNVGDAAELIEKYDCGVVVSDNSVKKLVSGIHKFNEFSDVEITEMGENSRNLAEIEFGLENNGERLIEVVESITKNK
jgi:glycosyltransferase involved in cell wall biosynthesis